MQVKFVLFYPNLEWQEVQEILPLLEKVGAIFDLKIEKKEIKKFGEEKLKSTILWPISVWKRIRIHQTRRTKSLYTQLVVFLDNKPFTFYPQGYGKERITIKQFLEQLIKGKVLCLHEALELEKKLKHKN
jgi:hypothetical protein